MRSPALSLRSRIALSFVGVFALVELVILVLVNVASYDITRGKISEELDVAERVFRRLLTQDAERLGQSARGLVSDFAFREAVASADRVTVASALENLAGRIQASGGAYLDRQGAVIASTVDLDGPAAALLADVTRGVGTARPGTDPHRILVIRDGAYQVVAAPVRSPVIVGWVLLFFPIDQTLAMELKRLTNLDVTFVTGQVGLRHVAASTRAVGEYESLVHQLPEGPGSSDWVGSFQDGAHQGRVISLQSGIQGGLIAAIDRPVLPSLKYYRYLEAVLLALGVAGILAATLVSVLVARGITRPLEKLRKSIGAITAGDYTIPVQSLRADEVGAVAQGLEHLRLGIRERESRILSLAYQDGLTGLPNRVAVIDQLRERIARAEAAGLSVSLQLVGLDRFRQVNDLLGHAAGDGVLKQVAERLASFGAGSVFVARLGGDEFAMIADDAAGVGEAAQAILALLEPPCTVGAQAVDVRASIGIATFPAHGQSAEDLLRRADVAMHVAKGSRSGWAVFDPALDSVRNDQLTLLGELQRAVDRHELEVFYQPKMSLSSGEVYAAEALLRWRHPERGRIPPGLFIPFAEKTGYIRTLTRWLVRDVARQVAEWNGRGLRVQVAINLSTHDLMDPAIATVIDDARRAAGIEPQSLRMEVTESGVMDDPERATQSLRQLSSLGHPLSVDDYGTGYSSLTYLRDLPLDELKIDRAFVSGVDGNPQLSTIVRSTVELAHGLGLTVVAEGVETEGELEVLRGLGCDFAQGYLLSPPAPARDFESWMMDFRRTTGRGNGAVAGATIPVAAEEQRRLA